MQLKARNYLIKKYNLLAALFNTLSLLGTIIFFFILHTILMLININVNNFKYFFSFVRTVCLHNVIIIMIFWYLIAYFYRNRNLLPNDYESAAAVVYSLRGLGWPRPEPDLDQAWVAGCAICVSWSGLTSSYFN